MNEDAANTLRQHYLKVQALTPQNPAVRTAATPPPPDDFLSFITQPLPLSILIFLVLVTVGIIALLITRVRDVNKILTVLFIALVTSAIPFGTQLAKEETRLQSLAGPAYTPKNVIVTQVTATSFSILWDTDEANVGAIRVRTTLEPTINQKVISEPEGQDVFKHAVKVTDLNPGTQYYLEVLSGSEWYNLNGQPIGIKTP